MKKKYTIDNIFGVSREELDRVYNKEPMRKVKFYLNNSRILALLKW